MEFHLYNKALAISRAVLTSVGSENVELKRAHKKADAV
jgi:hypothetical protein